MNPSTYLTPGQLSFIRGRLADEMRDRSTGLASCAAIETAWDICRPDMGGAYLSNIQSRASDRGLRAELDAVVERMAVTS